MLARISVARRLPQVFAARYSSSRAEGSVAESKGFSKKEKAHEDQFARQHELELLKKLKAEIEGKKAELETLQKEHAELQQKKD